MQENKNYNELLHTMKLIIDSITKDSAEQQGSLEYGDENTFIGEGIFREVDGEFVLDMYVLKGLDYSNLDTMMLLMPNNYTEVDIHEEDEEYFGLDVDGAIGKVLDAYPSIDEFQVRYFKLPDYAYLPEKDGGLETGLFIEKEVQEDDVISNYVDREYFEELKQYGRYDELMDDEFEGEVTEEELVLLFGEEEAKRILEDAEYNEELAERLEGEGIYLDDESTIDIYLFEGADFAKIEQDNIDLEDTGNYFKVDMTEEELQAIGVDVDSMLSQFGIDKEDAEVNYKVLPKCYYLTPEEGGYPYPHLKENRYTELEGEIEFKDERDHTNNLNLTDEQLRVIKLTEEQALKEHKEWMEEIEDELKSEIELDIRQANNKIVKLLEKVRKSGDMGELSQLNMKYIQSYLTEYSQRLIRVQGYYVTTDIELGVLTKTVHIVLDVEGHEGAWVLSYTGVYSNKGREKEFEFMEKNHLESNQFNLERVVSLPKEEVDALIDEDFG